MFVLQVLQMCMDFSRWRRKAIRMKNDIIKQ